ncbi:MAG: DNA primase [Clostridia bacterium]|nr:DNA primase [Clostridia bacterium]
MALSEEFSLELKSRNDIESVVSSYVNIKRGGRNPKGLCPFHNEKTPSFTLYPENGSFYCFGCGTGGDVIRFIRLIENLNYIDAVRFLADRCGMQMPVEGYDDSAVKLKQQVLAVNRETARYFHSMLKSPQGRNTYEYFRQRGLSDATIVHFGLGFSPEGWTGLCDHLRAKGFSFEEMIVAGVASKGRNGGAYDRFRGRAMFPILDVRGNVIGFGGRRMKEDDSAKYINTADTPVFKKSHNVYALNFAKNHGANRLILCEGYMDVIALHQAGFQNAVAPLGTAFTEEQAMLLSRYTKELVLTLDADAAGQKATDRALGILEKAGVDTRIIAIPDGKDPDEFMKKNGEEGPAKFRALLDGAVNDTEYKLFRAAQGLNMATDDGKVAYLEKAARVIGSLESAVEADVYAGRIAGQCGVSKEAVLTAAKTYGKQEKRRQYKEEVRKVIAPVRTDSVNPKRPLHRRAANAEEGLLAVLMKNQDFIPRVAANVDPSEFITDFNRKVYEELVARNKKGKTIDITVMGDAFTGEELGEIVRIQTAGVNRANTLDECALCLQIMREEQLKESFRQSGGDSDDEYIEKMKQLAKNKKKDVTE